MPFSADYFFLVQVSEVKGSLVQLITIMCSVLQLGKSLFILVKITAVYCSLAQSITGKCSLV